MIQIQEEIPDGRSAMAGNVKLRMDCGIHLYPFPSDLKIVLCDEANFSILLIKMAEGGPRMG